MQRSVGGGSGGGCGLPGPAPLGDCCIRSDAINYECSTGFNI